jgi:hypothetical protein
MGYSQTGVYGELYYRPSDTALALSPNEHTTASTIYVKVAEILLHNDIVFSSKFRFKFDLRIESIVGSVTAYGKIYRNGLPIGIEQSEAGSGYITKTEDINVVNWNRGDKIQLYSKVSAATKMAYTRNLTVCGDGSLWETIL